MKKLTIVAAVASVCLAIAAPALAFGLNGANIVAPASETTAPAPIEAEAETTIEPAAEPVATEPEAPAEAEAAPAVTPTEAPVAPESTDTGYDARAQSFAVPCFTDNDGDGICDNYGSGLCYQNGCTGYAAGSGAGAGYCGGYVDADGDGLCDNYGWSGCYHSGHSGYGAGYGNGYGATANDSYGNNGGYGYGRGHHGGGYGHRGGHCW